MKKLFILILILPLLWVCGAGAASYYYCETAAGSENASDCSNCDDIAGFNADAQSLTGDDFAYLCDTEVIRTTLTVPASGTADHPITIKNAAGDSPIISGADIIETWTLEAIGGGGEDFTDGTDETPMAYWYFDDASEATRLDETANNVDLADGNTSVDKDTTIYKQGTGGAKFVKADSTVLSIANASLPAGFPFKSGGSTTTATIGGWLYLPVAYTDLDVVLQMEPAGTDGGFHLILSYGAVKFQVRNTDYSNAEAESNSDLSSETWYHVVGRLQADGRVSIFINGVEQTDVVDNSEKTPGQCATPLAFGSRDTSSDRYVSATMDEWFVFSEALTDAEILDIATYGLTGLGLGPYNSYYKASATSPMQVMEDDVRLTEVDSKVGLASLGTWWFDDPNNRVYVRCTDDAAPSTHTMEWNVREKCIDNNDQDYIVYDGLKLEKSGLTSGGAFFYAYGGSNNTVQNCTFNMGYNINLWLVGDVTRQMTDWNILGNTSTYSGFHGISLAGYVSDSLVSNNTSHHDCQLGDQDYSGGIKLSSNNSTGNTVEYNKAYSNGNATVSTSGKFIGVGIYIDTVNTGYIVRFNKAYDNYMSGFMLEDIDNAEFYGNVSYGNDLGGRKEGGIFIYRGADGNKIYNNTSYGNYHGITLRSYGGAEMDDNLIINNISVGNTETQLKALDGAENAGTGSGNVYTYNCFGAEYAGFIWWGGAWDTEVPMNTYDLWETEYSATTSSLEEDPHLNADYTLDPSSPAKNFAVYLPGFTTKLQPTTTFGVGSNELTMEDILSIGAYGVYRGAAGM